MVVDGPSAIIDNVLLRFASTEPYEVGNLSAMVGEKAIVIDPSVLAVAAVRFSVLLEVEMGAIVPDPPIGENFVSAIDRPNKIAAPL